MYHSHRNAKQRVNLQLFEIKYKYQNTKGAKQVFSTVKYRMYLEDHPRNLINTIRHVSSSRGEFS